MQAEMVDEVELERTEDHTNGREATGYEKGLAVGVPGQLDLYLRQIDRWALLTAEDEFRLGALVQRGRAARKVLQREEVDGAEQERLIAEVEEGRGAEQQMIESNLRLVVSVAKRWAASGVPIADLIQEGNIGLMRAVGKYDPTRGFRLSTVATWWIRHGILRYIADAGRTIRLPVHIHDALLNLRRAHRTLTEQLGRPPTDQELAAAVGIGVQRLDELRRAAMHPVSLDDPLPAIGNGNGGEPLHIGDSIEDPGPLPSDEAEHTVMRLDIEAAMRVLTPRQRTVLRLRYGLDGGTPRTLDEVGKIVGVSRERIRQISETALETLRKNRSGRRLEQYFNGG